MKKSVLSVLLCLAIVLSSAAFAVNTFADDIGTTYYIDSVDGNNANSGTSPEKAWASLGKAKQMTYSAGDKILLKAGGIYIGDFVAKGSGTKENPITLSSYGDIEADGKPMIYTVKDIELIKLTNVSGWTIENLEMSAPNGKGIRVTADGWEENIQSDITIRNCDLHDIYYKKFDDVNLRDNRYSAIYKVAFGKNSRIDNFTVSNCNIYNCAYGIYTDATEMEGNPEIFVSPELSYNQNCIIENSSLHNIYYDAIIIRGENNMIVRNLSIIKTSLSFQKSWYAAPMYMSNVNNVLVENCEIAGSENYNDGMAIDLDGFTTNSTYQYLYSHDNPCFMRNCIYDDVTKNRNNTVRYCLSVNDNKTVNYFGQPCKDQMYEMENFKFYNNTIVNGCDFQRADTLKNSYIANNIFVSDKEGRQIFNYYERWNAEKGKTYTNSFTGTFTNNCLYGYTATRFAKNSVKCNPSFAGTDLTDVNSFMLRSDSKLIGKGVQVEENMGERDFYGNPLTEKHNIGCYEGEGIKSESKDSAFNRVEYFFIQLAADFLSCFKTVIYYYGGLNEEYIANV